MNGKQDAMKRRRAVRHAVQLNLGVSVDEAGDWKSEDADYQTEFLSASHLLADMAGLEGDPELLALKDQPVQIPLAERFGGFGPRLAMVASLVMATVVGLMIFGQQATNPGITMDRYVTRIGEQKVVNLSDGSVVTLNTGSEFLAELTDNSRKIILRRGEAYFDVAPDAERPFIVDAGLRSVTVLGTEFNVRKSPGRLQVAVNEGLVAIHSPQEIVSAGSPLISGSMRDAGKRTPRPAGQYRLPAGWVVEVDSGREHLVAYAPESLQSISLWRTGTLDFDNVSLVDVVRELNRYSGKKILIEDASIVDLKVLGVIQVDRINLALQGLEHALPIKVVHHFDQIVLTGDQ